MNYIRHSLSQSVCQSMTEILFSLFYHNYICDCEWNVVEIFRLFEKCEYNFGYYLNRLAGWVWEGGMGGCEEVESCTRGIHRIF